MPLTPFTPALEEALALLTQETEACWKSVLEGVFGPAGPALKVSDVTASAGDRLWFSSSLTPTQLGSLWFGLDRSSALELGRLLLASKGRDSEHEHHAFYATSHLLGQLAATLASGFLSRSHSAVSVGECSVGGEPPASAQQFQLPLGSSNHDRTLTVSTSSALLSVIANPSPSSAALVPGTATARNLDLLLDLEMPVSISFGSTRIALKDVARLNTGSIVELNRALSEPVDVVVNNCAIARGEVVVVDGNFAVRISEVVSKQDRLRSLS